MTYTADPRVGAYIDALPDWQQAICREVRDLVHAADHEVAEWPRDPAITCTGETTRTTARSRSEGTLNDHALKRHPCPVGGTEHRARQIGRASCRERV